MLLVITGAGASWDSIPKVPDFEPGDFYRPPLAKSLFDTERSNFGNALMDFSAANPLVMDLRRQMRVPDGPALEEALETFQAEGESGRQSRVVQLTAVQFYLQRILWECSLKWHEKKYGQTNYIDLLSRIERWRHETGQEVAFVTFNYDTLLDSAFTTVFQKPFNEIDDYTSDETLSLFKVHGSANWGQLLYSPAFDLDIVSSGEQDVRNHIISSALHIEAISNGFALMDGNLTPWDNDSHFLLPAVAIPFAKKYSFACPDPHLRWLERGLERVDRILVIGWRGNEQHFLKLMEESIPHKAPLVQIVGVDSAGVTETKTNLVSTGLYEGKMWEVEGGFSNYLDQDFLETFLAASVAEGVKGITT